MSLPCLVAKTLPQFQEEPLSFNVAKSHKVSFLWMRRWKASSLQARSIIKALRRRVKSVVRALRSKLPKARNDTIITCYAMPMNCGNVCSAEKCRRIASLFAAMTPSQESGLAPTHHQRQTADLALCTRPAAPQPRQSVNTAWPAQLFQVGRRHPDRPRVRAPTLGG
jgi:hypothetical protein